ncbi:MFS transporter [Krasilnikovia cinnamomea]|uniref:MFS transporter n=1 Tax=Krasilnikovia cinnamomea TaxID=349313 RepID=UPI001A92B92B|nr:MFS transporter [Krasilnikovia cinnamomea]
MSRHFPRLVFLLTFGLLLSDYMSRQVLAAVFPYLKADWRLTDTQLGALTGIVALMVGVFAIPLSMVGDRWGRVRAVIVMAVAWSLATVGSAFAAGFGQLMAARVLIGVGEAAYASVGLAVVLSVFPATRRASLAGAFTAGGAFGGVLGVAVGGAIAAQFGWRWAFAAMGAFGLILAAGYAILVDEDRLRAHRVAEPGAGPGSAERPWRAGLSTVFATPSVLMAYVACGTQLFVAAALVAWLPSYLHRVHAMAPSRAAGVASLLILILGAGMIGGGVIADRVSRDRPARIWSTAVVISALSLGLLAAGFLMRPGGLQLVVLAAGCFWAAGTTGPCGAVVARLTPDHVRATAFGVLTLFNNVLGLAVGPIVIGMLADRLGLQAAMRYVPVAAVPAIAALLIGGRAYPSSLRRLGADPAGAGPANPAGGSPVTGLRRG